MCGSNDNVERFKMMDLKSFVKHCIERQAHNVVRPTRARIEVRRLSRKVL